MNNFGIPAQGSKYKITALLLALWLFLSVSAVWGQSDEYFYIRYNGNGADSGSISEEYVHGTEITLKKNEKVKGSSDVPYEKDGCSFVGWSMKESVDEGLVEIIPGGEIWTVDDEAIIHYYNEKIKGYTLYAWWKCPEGIVGNSGTTVLFLRYNGNGADRGNIVRQTAENGASLTVKGNADSDEGDLVLTRQGYVFDGWNTKADGSGDAYKAGDSILLDQDVTLYAQWKSAPAPTPLPTNIPDNEPAASEEPDDQEPEGEQNSIETVLQNVLVSLNEPTEEVSEASANVMVAGSWENALKDSAGGPLTTVSNAAANETVSAAQSAEPSAETNTLQQENAVQQPVTAEPNAALQENSVQQPAVNTEPDAALQEAPVQQSYNESADRENNTVQQAAEENTVQQENTVRQSENAEPPRNEQFYSETGRGFFWLSDYDFEMPQTGLTGKAALTRAQKPASVQYEPVRMDLQIPVLNLFTNIVSVSPENGRYPIDWLEMDSALLADTALPGQGLSVIVGHNTLSAEEFGPFALISLLNEGDRFFVRDEENRLMIFEVYANEKISPYDYEVMHSIASAYESTMTLLTCEDERAEGGYASRRIVSARQVM